MSDTEMTKVEKAHKKRTEFLASLEPYVRERLLPRMGLPARDVRLETPRFGERSMVLFLHAAGKEYVVRCFPRRSGRVRTLRVARHCRRRGVRVPAIHHVDASRAARRRLGCSFLVEERIPGLHVLEFPDRRRMIEIVAHGVSRMHNQVRSRWGNLTYGRRGGYFERLVGKFRTHLDRLTALGSDLQARREEALLRWLEDRREAVRRLRKFSLTHRATAGDNVMITPEEEFCLIDVQRLCYEHFAANLIRAVHVFTRTDEEEELFLRAYFEAAEGRTLEEFREWEGFFSVLHVARIQCYSLAKGYRMPAGEPFAEDVLDRVLESPSR